jgi:hypothetical protein
MKNPTNASDTSDFEQYLKQFKPASPITELNHSISNSSKQKKFEANETRTSTWLWVAASWLTGLIMGGSLVLATRTTTDIIAEAGATISIASELQPVAAASSNISGPDTPAPDSFVIDNRESARRLDTNIFSTSFSSSPLGRQYGGDENSILSARGFVARTTDESRIAMRTPMRSDASDIELDVTGGPLSRRDLIRELLKTPAI